MTIINPGAALAAPEKPATEGGSGAGTTGAAAEARAQILAQQPLSDASDRVQRAIHAIRATGFTGIAIQGDKLAVWWKEGDAIPGAVGAAIAVARRSVTVELRTAPYSLAELEKASARFVEQIRDNPRPLHMVKIPPEGTGLIVSALPGTPDATVKGAAARLADHAGINVPVKTVIDQPVRLNSRGDDSPPWKGGARIQNGVGFGCTSAFGVNFLGNADYVLTAAHCAYDNLNFFDGAGEFIGNSGANLANISHDIALIGANPLGNLSASNLIYDGGVGSGEFTKRVSGWANPTVGEHVCLSGASSGVKCNLFVTNTNTGYCVITIPGLCLTSMVSVEVRAGGGPTIGGDSGAPLFTPLADGTARAKGVYSGILAGGPPYILMFQDFGTVNADFGVVPKT